MTDLPATDLPATDLPATDLPATGIAECLASAAFGLAGGIAAGATLWAVAPGFEDHARHVAVEFVHPVIAGTRAVRAVALVGADVVSCARSSCEAGDVAILVGAGTAEVARRCRAWGVLTVAVTWPDRGLADSDANADGVPADDVSAIVVVPADHVIAIAGEADAIRAYHLLWELTQLCLEDAGGEPAPADPTSCAVCADQALVGEVTALVANDEVELRTACGPVRVDTSLFTDLAVGDLVLAHGGTVIGRDGPG